MIFFFYSTSTHILILTSTILISPWRTEMPPMIKLLLTQLRPLRSAKSPLNAPLLPLMKRELKNSDLSKCGSHPMELLETSLMVPYSESLLLSVTSQELSQDGPSQSLSEDTPMEISTEHRMPSKLFQVRLSSFSPQEMEAHPPPSSSTISRDQVPTSVCTTPQSPSRASPEHA